MSKILKKYGNIFLDSLPFTAYYIIDVIIAAINLHYCTSPVMIAGLGTATALIHTFGTGLIIAFN